MPRLVVPGLRRSQTRSYSLLGLAALALSVLLAPRPAQAQLDSGYIRSFPNGAQTSIDTEDGVRCSANGGTRPYATVFSGYDGVPDNGIVINNNSINQLGTGILGGVSMTIPLGDSQLEKCDRLRSLQEAKSSLALANQLFEAGLMSEAELKALGDQLKPLLLGRDYKPTDTAATPPAAPPAAKPPRPAAKPAAPAASESDSPDEAEQPARPGKPGKLAKP